MLLSKGYVIKMLYLCIRKIAGLDLPAFQSSLDI